MVPEILTDRLRINDLIPDDAPALFDYHSDTEVARFQSWRSDSVDATRTFIVRNASAPFWQERHPVSVGCSIEGRR